jgi:hypothetical protein
MVSTPSATVRVVTNPATNGVAISTMRDRFVQEMHRNVSLLNTSATERKFARIIRNERNRIDSIVRIQAVARGYIVRSSLKLVTHYDISSKQLQGDEVDLSTAQIELMDRYIQALAVAIFKNDSVDGNDKPSPSRPMTASSRAALKNVADLISSEMPEEFGMEEAVEVDDEVDVFDHITDPVEKMKIEMLEIHRQQLKKQRDEMKELFALEMKGLGTQIIQNFHHEDDNQQLSHHQSVTSQHHASVLESFRQSGVGSASQIFQHELSHSHTDHGNNTLSRVSCGQNMVDVDSYIFGMDETIIQDIDWMKDMYLDIWGNAEFHPVEVIAIMAKSKTHFTILDASLKDQLCDVVHVAGTKSEFIRSHHVYFVKEPENKDSFSMKVRLVNSSGKACKLRCPGDKIADLCENRRTVKITLDSKNQFEIASSSLRLDQLSRCLECLWDAHVAWMAQRLLIRIALHRVVQGISALFVSFPQGEKEDELPQTETEVADGIETTENYVADINVERNLVQAQGETVVSSEETSGGDEMDPESRLDKETPSVEQFMQEHAIPKDRWMSHRYILFQELASILKSGQEHFEHYQESLQQTQIQLTSIIEAWKFFEYSSSVSNSIPVNELSEQLYLLASSLFAPYEVYFTAEGSERFVNGAAIKEKLQSRHDRDTIQPILKGIYLDFISFFSVKGVFEEFCLGPLMTLSHQKVVKGYAYAETYDWRSLCAHTRTWSYLLHGYDADFSSPLIQAAYETYLNIVLQADAEVYKPQRKHALEVDMVTHQYDEDDLIKKGSEFQEEEEEEEDEEPQRGLEIIAAIESFTSRVLTNTLDLED